MRCVFNYLLLFFLVGFAGCGNTSPEGDRNIETVTAADLKELVAQKEYSLIYFWTTWCGPCRKTLNNTLPELSKLIDKDKVQILVVAVSKDEDRLSKTLEARDLNAQSLRLEFFGPDIFVNHKLALKNTLEELFPEENVWKNSVPVFVLADRDAKVIQPDLPSKLEKLKHLLQTESKRRTGEILLSGEF